MILHISTVPLLSVEVMIQLTLNVSILIKCSYPQRLYTSTSRTKLTCPRRFHTIIYLVVPKGLDLGNMNSTSFHNSTCKHDSTGTVVMHPSSKRHLAERSVTAYRYSPLRWNSASVKYYGGRILACVIIVK